MQTTIELCPVCMREVKMPANSPAHCPHCGHYLYPCSICRSEKNLGRCDWDKQGGCWRFPANKKSPSSSAKLNGPQENSLNQSIAQKQTLLEVLCDGDKAATDRDISGARAFIEVCDLIWHQASLNRERRVL